MVSRFLIIACLLVVARTATANADVIVPWHSAIISFGDPQEKNFVRISSSVDDELTEFTVRWQGHDLQVPPSEFKSLPDVQLRTIQVLRGEFTFGPDQRPYLNISLRFGDDTFGEYPLAWVLFYSGKFHHITFIKRTSKTVSDYIDKYPGKEPVKAGTSTVIREAPSPKPK